MKLILTPSSLFVLSALVPLSWSSPVSPVELGRSLGPLQERNSGNTCDCPWIQAAETLARKGSLRRPISSLCSSVLSKYKTVTHSVFTKTVYPTTTNNAAFTASQRTVTAQATVEVTQQETDVVGSTSVRNVTQVYTEPTTVETDTVYVTETEVALQPRNQWPCQQVESLLHLAPKSATPFCSCYAPGPTSTTTVTCKGVTTEPPAHVTHRTTLTPTPATVVKTVFQTTTVITTEVSGTVVTSTVTEDTFVSVTAVETVTSTVNPAPIALTSGHIQVNMPGSKYDGLFGYVYTGSEADGSPILLSNGLADAPTAFQLDSNGYLNVPSADYTADQFIYQQQYNQQSNQILVTVRGVVTSNPDDIRLVWQVAPGTNLLTTAETVDPRVVLQICPAPPPNGFFTLPWPAYPDLVLDVGLNNGCELAVIKFVSP